MNTFLRSASSRSRQRGVTLVVVLLLLVVVMLFTSTAINSSTTNLRVTGNMIARQEAGAAAQALIDETISSIAFTTNPAAVAASEYPVDVDDDGSADYLPRLDPVPECREARVLKTTELDTSEEADLACFTSGTVANSGVDTPDASATAGSSLCANTEWNIRATVEDARTGVQVALNQGVGVRVLATDAADYCEE